MRSSYKLLGKLLTLMSLIIGLIVLIPPGENSIAALPCDDSVYEFCWSQGRLVNSETCECNYQSCFGVPEANCTEQGYTLDYETCMCQPGYLTPWCPTSLYSTCFNQGTFVDPISCSCFADADGGMPLCTFDSYAWCKENRGAWQGMNCKCGFKDTNNNCTASASVRLSCENSGGTWNVSDCLCDY